MYFNSISLKIVIITLSTMIITVKSNKFLYSEVLQNLTKLDDIFTSITNLIPQYAITKTPSYNEFSCKYEETYGNAINMINSLASHIDNFITHMGAHWDFTIGVYKKIPMNIYDNIIKIHDMYNNVKKMRLTNFTVVVRLPASNFEESNIIDILYKNFRTAMDINNKKTYSEEYLEYFKREYGGNYSSNCDKFVSAQQEFYYVTTTMIITEIIGFINTAYLYTMRQILCISQHHYTIEAAQHTFMYRIARYLEATRKQMKQMPTVIRRCDPRLWKRGASFIELEGHVQNWLLDEQMINSIMEEVRPQQDCIFECKVPAIFTYKPTSDSVISDCFNLAKPVDACYSSNASSRLIEWIKTPELPYLGRYHECSNITTFDGNRKFTGKQCFLCVCEVIRQQKILITRQASNTLKNMIVTGVKFVKNNGVLQLQIKEGKLVSDGIVDDNVNWTDVNYINYDDDDTHATLQYNGISWFYLQDVKLPRNHVVTGIRFAQTRNGWGIKILVRGTIYDLVTGQLNVRGNIWFDPEDVNVPFSLEQIKISGMDDDPRLSDTHIPIEDSKHYVGFTHTNFIKDAGQMTIPLLDSQEVTMIPSFPLNGIGLYYKGAEGYGGFISLRLYTDNMENYIATNSSKFDDNKKFTP